MNISNEAIEAAAKAAHFRKLTGVQWDDLPKWKRIYRLSEALAALEAAAPFIAADAWDEGAESCIWETGNIPHHPDNPYRKEASIDCA